MNYFEFLQYAFPYLLLTVVIIGCVLVAHIVLEKKEDKKESEYK